MSALILVYMCSAHEGWAASLHKWWVWRTEKQCFSLSWSRVKPTDSSCFHWITTSTTAWIKPMSKSPCWSCAIDCDIMYYTQTCVLTETDRERLEHWTKTHGNDAFIMIMCNGIQLHISGFPANNLTHGTHSQYDYDSVAVFRRWGVIQSCSNACLCVPSLILTAKLARTVTP